MKRKVLKIALAATMAMAFGVTFAGCGGNTDPALNGTWDGGLMGMFALELNNGNWELRALGTPEARGTYTARGGTITFRMTEERHQESFGVSQWLQVSHRNTGTYTVEDNRLTISLSGEMANILAGIFTRR